jgi:hypothetical protein
VDPGAYSSFNFYSKASIKSFGVQPLTAPFLTLKPKGRAATRAGEQAPSLLETYAFLLANPASKDFLNLGMSHSFQPWRFKARVLGLSRLGERSI